LTQRRKRVRRFVFAGLGFPVELRNVELIRFRDSWAPDVKLNRLTDDAFLALATKPAPLTGDEVKFVRHRMRLTLQAFAERFHVTHQAVMKWERSREAVTDMNWGTEVAIRLEILHTAKLRPAKFVEAYKTITRLSAETNEALVMVHDPKAPEFAGAGFDSKSRLARAPHVRNR